MANIKFTNFARTALAVGAGSGDVTMSVTGGTGALFPALTAGQYFYAVLENATLDREIVKVTARSTDTLTVTRGQDNTTARAWVAGDIVSLRLNAAAIEEAGVIAGVVSGDLAFTGTANRIRGDFSNATITNRVAFQTSTPATFTALSAVPTGTESYLTLYQYSDINNCSYSAMSALNTEMRLDSGKTGVGSYRPMTFYTGGSERMRIDEGGNVTVTNATGGLGYGTGAGGTVTQATSRTTPVTINKPTGAITMFSAAGSATPAQFTVQNSLVAATDVVVLSYKSSSNVYQFVVSNVAAGSFNISFWTQSGVASDTPVINFAIIKGVIA